MSRWIKSDRLQRGKRIKSTDVKEFRVVQEDPLIAYCVIQGSAADPYYVSIDLETNVVTHNCPDFVKRGSMCKHFGKLFHLVGVEKVSEALIELDELTMDTLVTPQKIDKYRVKGLIHESQGEKSDLTTAEMVTVFKRTGAESVLNHIVENLHGAITNMDFQGFIFLFVEIFEGEELKPVLRRRLIERIGAELDERTLNFVQSVRTMNFVWGVEMAEFIAETYRMLGVAVPTKEVEFRNISKQRRENTLLILDRLYTHNEESPPWIRKLKEEIGFSSEKTMRKFQRAATIHGTRYLRSQDDDEKRKRYQEFEDFLIHCILANGENPKLRVSFHGGVGRLSQKVLEMNPATKWAVDHIKGSERDYITNKEYWGHKNLFQWLSDRSYTPRWIERPRMRVPNYQVHRTGIIVQWEPNLRSIYEERFIAFDENRRLVMDENKIVARTIQPLDYTLCSIVANKPREYQIHVKPMLILFPDQVVSLVKAGVKIISGVLPWKVLEKYSQNMLVEKEELILAVKKCDDHRFAFGSQVLKKELEEILALLTDEGNLPEVYKEIRNKILEDTGRLNNRTRPLLNKLITIEGTELDSLLEIIVNHRRYYYLEEEEKFEVVNTILKKSSTVEDFRREVVKEVAELFIRTEVFVKLLRRFKEKGFHKYHDALNELIFSRLRGDWDELRKNNLQAIGVDNYIYRLMCASRGVKSLHYLSHNDRKVIKRMILKYWMKSSLSNVGV